MPMASVHNESPNQNYDQVALIGVLLVALAVMWWQRSNTGNSNEAAPLPAVYTDGDDPIPWSSNAGVARKKRQPQQLESKPKAKQHDRKREPRRTSRTAYRCVAIADGLSDCDSD